MSKAKGSPQPPPKPTYQVKMILMGAANGGKTSLAYYLINDVNIEGVNMTVGCDYSKLDVETETANYVTLIHDTAGQDRYFAMTPIYVRDSDIALVVINAAEDESLDVVHRYIKMTNDYSPTCHMIFVLNKCDLVDAPEIEEKIENIQIHLAEFCNFNDKAAIITTSALTGMNVNELHQDLFSSLSLRGAILEALEKKTPELALREQQRRPKLAVDESKQVNPCCL